MYRISYNIFISLLDFDRRGVNRTGGGSQGGDFYQNNRFAGPAPTGSGGVGGVRGIPPLLRGGPPFPPRLGPMFMRGPRPGIYELQPFHSLYYHF